MSGFNVEVSARKIIVPYFCPCCSGVADTEMPVSFTRVTGERFMRETTLAFDFPYCSRCVEHTHQWTDAWSLTGRIIAGGMGACAIAVLAGGPILGAAALAAAIAVAIGVGLARQRRARAACCPGCVGAGPAVTYHGWDGTVQAFAFTSSRYAAEFAEQNERRLVNVAPHLTKLLEDCAIAEPPPPPLARRPRATLPMPINAAQAGEQEPEHLWPQRAERPRVLDYLAQLEQSAVAGVVVAKRVG